MKTSIWQTGRKKWLLGIPIGGFLMIAVGAIAMIGFDKTMVYTNSNEFCYGCHVGMDTIVEEYEASIHFTNRTGVQATCSDCHVPHEFLPKMWVKIKATKDIYHTMVGTFNLENFESHRLELAHSARAPLIARDSKECRTCHNDQQWVLAAQSPRAQLSHDPEFMAANNRTCVNCHIGIAHKKPR